MAYSYKCNLSFGFVFIPVTLHVTVKENRFSFRLFDKKTKSKIQYKKTCENCNGREVKQEELVKGYEYDDGKYVLIQEEDLEKIKTPKDKTITIDQFVDLSEIDPLYFIKSYYIIPSGAEKAYCLLLKAMKATKKVGIGTTVLGNHETIILLYPQENHLILSTLYFQEEVKACPSFQKETSFTPNEMKLAKMLIEEMTSPLHLEQYHDNYAKRIQKMISDKIKGKAIVTPKAEKVQKVDDLMEALQTSLAQYHKKDAKKRKSPSSRA